MSFLVGRCCVFIFLALAGTASAAAANSPSCAELKRLSVNDSCVTSRGVLVKRVRRGDLEGVEVGGLFWTDSLFQATPNKAVNSMAEKICGDTDSGLHLPTRREFETLDGSFDKGGPASCRRQP